LKPRTVFFGRPAAVALGLIAVVKMVGCDYSAPSGQPQVVLGRVKPGAVPVSSRGKAAATSLAPVGPARASEERTAILESSITLIKRAALSPGGDNFRLAVQKLNHYFEGTSPSEYVLDNPSREFLKTRFPVAELRELESKTWTPFRDTRHIEDCMMYYGIAMRVAGTGDDLARVRRVFDWVVRQVQLVPPGSLSLATLGQAYARPYDILLRGMATESEGFWAERSWLFMVLCRQLGIDSGLIAYSKSNTLIPTFPRYGSYVETESTLRGARKLPNPPIIWVCTAVIDGKAYLFDARLGLEIPGPDGEGVATLNDAMSDPAVLERMNLPGMTPYGTSQASLVGSPSKISILIDSSPGYFSPKMKLLQSELYGKNRTILYRSPAEQRDNFAKALGNRLGDVELWALPMQVEQRLFTDPNFVKSIQASLVFFRPEWPLLYARIKHLRGDLDASIEEYVKLRFAENAPQVLDKKQTIPKEVQDALDIYATYYLGLAQLEKNKLDEASLMFERVLAMLPAYGPGQPYYNMFRWGAHTNLGRIFESRKDYRSAIAHYSAVDPTTQFVGNQIRARDLVWKDPMAERPDPLPPAPEPQPRVVAPAAGAARAPGNPPPG
jgi:hypothetical protein